jgi:hypothetical protein
MLHQAIGRRDYDHIVNLVCDKEDLLEPMPEIPKLVQRLFHIPYSTPPAHWRRILTGGSVTA